MEKDKNEQEDYQLQVDSSRASVFGHKTQDHEITQSIVNTIIDSHHYIDIEKFVKVLQTHPNIKEQTKLVEKVFSNRQVIEDMIRFLINPQIVISKYNLKEIQARRFINPIKEFITNNYQFYQHFFLSVQKSQLDYQIWFQFLQNKVDQTYFTSLGYLQHLFIPIIKYEYSTTSRVSQFYQHNYNTQKSILIISHFTEKTISLILRFTQYSAIFKIIFNIILASLQELQWKKSLNLLKQLCLSSLHNERTLDTHIENVYWMAREVSNNIEKDVHNTIFAFINAFVESNFVKASINRISQILISYGQSKTDPVGLNEETALENNIKLLVQLINIYYLLRKIGIDYMATQMLKLKANIEQIYNYLNQLMASMRNVQTKTLKFSNGQNIKICLLCRFQVLNLLKISLLLVKQYGQTIPQFQNKIDKSLVFQFLIVCMSGNRWNNIVQCLIQKIICIIVNPQIFKTTNAWISKFLKFIVQTFSNKKYMFLDSAKMINQGDIHFLYFISRKITVQLDRLPGIIQISSQYDFWKKFVLNVLQKYQNTNDRLSKISQPVEIYDNKIEKDQDFRVEIDELASIKEIVKKFEVNQKWTFKGQSHKYALPRVGSAQNLVPKIPHQSSEKTAGSPTVHKSGTNSIKKKKSHGLQQAIQLLKTQSNYQTSISKSGQIDLYHHEESSHSDSQVVHDEELSKKQTKS